MNKPLIPSTLRGSLDTGTRSAASRPESWDAAKLTFEATVATPHPVVRRDARGEYLEILSPDTLAEDGLTDRPVFDSHRGGTARATIGVVLGLHRDGNSVVGLLRLSGADDVAPIRQRVAEGTIRHVSIGYRVAGWRESRDGEGRRVKTPTAWSITEVSLVPDPADPNARIRATQAPDDPARSGGTLYNRAAFLGGKMPVTETEAPDSAELSRRSDIRALCRSAALSAETADELIDAGATLDEAKAAAFDHVQKRSRTAPVIRTATVANDDPATITRRQSDAVATRMSGGACPDDARQYLGDSMLDMARGALERSGVSTRGLTPDEVFTRAAHSTSDFPLVVSNAMGKTAAQAYTAAECAIKKLCRQRVLRDFKPSTSIRVGEMGKLEQVAENGEITHTSRAENGESMQLKTFARGITVSRQLLINDDLGLLGDMTAAFGEAAAQTEADILVDLLTGAHTLSDSVAVFHASRGNLAGANAAIAESAVNAGRKAMRTVKGLDGATIVGAAPKFLLVGPESETEAEKFLATIAPVTVDDAQPIRLELLVESRLVSDQWYLFADPARLPSMVYGYLASAQGVQIQRAEAWDTLGLKYRAFLDFGAGWTDWRGAYTVPAS